MDAKDRFYLAMSMDNGCHDEIDLGGILGLNEDTTRRIISALLAEYRIEYIRFGECNYKIKQTKKQKHEYKGLYKVCQ